MVDKKVSKLVSSVLRKELFFYIIIFKLPFIDIAVIQLQYRIQFYQKLQHQYQKSVHT
jgi:hypothetical protein